VKKFSRSFGVLNREGLPIVLVEQKAPSRSSSRNRAYVCRSPDPAQIDPRTVKSPMTCHYYLG